MSNENNWFARRLPVKTPKKSKFHFTPDYKSTGKIGQLQPFYVEECIPGDKFTSIHSSAYIRLQPLFTPIMHRLKIRTNYFFTPMRLFLTEDNFNLHFQHAGDPDYRIPSLTVPASYLGKNSLWDYFGCQPVESTAPVIIPNPIPFLMYLKIWSIYYADETLDADYIESVNSLIEDYRNTPLGDNYYLTPSAYYEKLFNVQLVSYTKDYFTTAQPQPYKGVDVKLSSSLVSLQGISQTGVGHIATRFNDSNTGSIYDSISGEDMKIEGDSISDLWKKMAIQRWANKQTIYGDSRYAEYLAGHYGIITQDSRLQMPQYLGGADSFVNISQVIQTSQSNTGESALGELAGNGIGINNAGIKLGVQEHGFVIGLISIVPEIGYTTGCPRWLFKNDALDLAVPEFNNIGPQPVYNAELYKANWDQLSDNTDGEFGYQPRYSEYRVHNSIAVGNFRKEMPFTSWHLNRVFDSLPPLNGNFVKVNPSDVSRAFNSLSDDVQFFMDVQNDIHVFRPISYLPNPDLL